MLTNQVEQGQRLASVEKDIAKLNYRTLFVLCGVVLNLAMLILISLDVFSVRNEIEVPLYSNSIEPDTNEGWPNLNERHLLDSMHNSDLMKIDSTLAVTLRRELDSIHMRYGQNIETLAQTQKELVATLSSALNKAKLVDDYQYNITVDSVNRQVYTEYLQYCLLNRKVALVKIYATQDQLARAELMRDRLITVLDQLERVADCKFIVTSATLISDKVAPFNSILYVDKLHFQARMLRPQILLHAADSTIELSDRPLPSNCTSIHPKGNTISIFLCRPPNSLSN